jgi:hypothetical protein
MYVRAPANNYTNGQTMTAVLNPHITFVLNLDIKTH